MGKPLGLRKQDDPYWMVSDRIAEISGVKVPFERTTREAGVSQTQKGATKERRMALFCPAKLGHQNAIEIYTKHSIQNRKRGDREMGDKRGGE